MGDPAVLTETITVIGTGSAEAAPNLLVATFGAELRADSVTEALDGAVRAMADVIAKLRAGGVSDLDLNTGSASIRSMLDEDGDVTGYTANQRLTARLRNLPVAGALVSEAVAAGGDAARLYGLAFALSDTRLVDEWARVQAWQDARAKAGQLASLAGRTLGPVLRMRETGSGPVPMMHAVSLSMSSMPLEPGTETVRVSIEVEWAFLP
ncbi:MAG TPA: SIMPL domain-containing protein [Mycobacteriales bacterium]|nr:SIMPL domain-containing protein [Mycobacteriales bacterium]